MIKAKSFKGSSIAEVMAQAMAETPHATPRQLKRVGGAFILVVTFEECEA